MPPFSGRHRSMTPWVGCRSPSASTVGRVKQDSSSLGSAAQRLTLSRYVARLKPRCGSLALSVMWYVLTVSQVGAMARFEWNLLSVNIRSKSYRVDV